MLVLFFSRVFMRHYIRILGKRFILHSFVRHCFLVPNLYCKLVIINMIRLDKSLATIMASACQDSRAFQSYVFVWLLLYGYLLVVPTRMIS